MFGGWSSTAQMSIRNSSIVVSPTYLEVFFGDFPGFAFCFVWFAAAWDLPRKSNACGNPRSNQTLNLLFLTVVPSLAPYGIGLKKAHSQSSLKGFPLAQPAQLMQRDAQWRNSQAEPNVPCRRNSTSSTILCPYKAICSTFHYLKTDKSAATRYSLKSAQVPGLVRMCFYFKPWKIFKENW